MATSEQLRNDAADARRTSLLIKGLCLLLGALIVLVAVLYVASYFFERYSAFTVAIDKYDMVNQGLTLSETEDFQSRTSRLQANAMKECTNISGLDLPDNIDTVNGEHSGSNYIAYTFYIKNAGIDTVSYEYSVILSNITQNVDEAIRIRLFRNGESQDYAKVRSDGSGEPEDGCVSFRTQSVAVDEYRREFVPGEVDKFTVVIWVEGDDADCVDAIIGGRMKLDMAFAIAEG